jgi:hexosaminidase
MVDAGRVEADLSPLGFAVETESMSAVLNAAIERYQNQQLFFPFPTTPHEGTPIKQRFTLVVAVGDDDDSRLALGMQESYFLSVPTPPTPGAGEGWRATLKAPTVWGALRGLETFSQLIRWNDASETYSMPDLPITIVDWPRFPWRGIMLDVSRHYLPTSAIKRTLDAMSYNKFNVLHIHATDGQSLPVESTRYPNLTKAAWGKKAVYSHADLHDIVQHAWERGIRVIPEWEMPGHAYGFGVGYPFMVADCPSYTTDINMIPLNIASDRVYDFLLNFLSEMTTIFPDEFMHFGGDEVAVDCWLHDPAIKQWGLKHNLTDPYRMFAYFEERLATLVQPSEATAKGRVRPPMAKQDSSLPPYINRTMVVWQDVWDDNWAHLAHEETVVEVWLDQNTLAGVIDKGYRAIWAYPWYLDQQNPGMAPKKSSYEWVDTWMAFYEAEPFRGLNMTEEQENMMLGGEGCMWGENVDETNIDSRIWPRAAAIAERLWSAASVSDPNAARPRLVNFRCNSLARRGIGAGPVMQDYCPLPPHRRA